MHHSLAPQQTEGATPLPDPAQAATDAAIALVRRKVLDADPEFRHLADAGPASVLSGPHDVLLAAEDEPHDPEQAFGQLRWGGEFIYISRDRREVAVLPEKFRDRGYAIVRGPASVRSGWRIPLFSPKVHYLIARKTALIAPREFSDRFTYQVELEHRDLPSRDGAAERGTDHWVVRKEIPTFERVLARLQFKAPDVAPGVIERRARKFVDQIFPLFLTREAAMLKIIERDCPREFLHRFPRVVDVQKDAKGYVHKLWTTWIRNGGQPLSQLQFARQSAELLHILHDRIGIIHLDLRMDNMVITEGGVGFVDFGSAVRVNENIHGNAVLSTLFGELMRTSQIQRMMDRMSTAGSLTSSIIREAYQQVDKSVDVFYLAMQISQPTANPDIRDLVLYDKYSPEAVELAHLTGEILRPSNPEHPRYRSARDVLQEILRIEAKLKAGHTPRVVITTPQEPVEKPKVFIWK
jgi:hypothetical protein